MSVKIGAFLSIALAAGAIGQSQYSEWDAIPRNMTPKEELIWKSNPPQTLLATPPPTGPVRCPGEYEPADGILIAWEGPGTWKTILSQMGQRITTTGNANLYVAVDDTLDQSDAQAQLTASGTNMARVKYILGPTDTVWIRDYGPRYIYQGNCRAMVDHVYNRPRPSDDNFPFLFSTWKNHALYGIPLIHGGGNFHLNGIGKSFVTKLINNENPSLTQTQIHDHWFDFQRVDTHFFEPFPTNIDSTQHIDMWMQIYADNKVMISDWPLASGSTQDQICDGAATYMASQGWTVTRIPAVTSGGTHYTFTNVVICNDLVLIPLYTNGTAATYNNPAMAAWQSAMPGKTVVQVNCQALVTSAGVMHCIVKHIPAPLNGINPTAYVTSPNNGGAFSPGQIVPITWITDDDVAATAVNIHLSLDGGATYPIALATNAANTGAFNWTVPNEYTDKAKIRVTALDAQSNSGSDETDSNMTINGLTPATLISYSAVNGSAYSGTLSSLVNTDNQRLGLRAAHESANGSKPLTITVAATSSVLVPTQIQLRLELRTSDQRSSGDVYLKNWITNDWQQVGSIVITKNDRINAVAVGSGASSFVRNDGRIEVEIRQRSASISPYRTEIDWVHLRLK